MNTKTVISGACLKEGDAERKIEPFRRPGGAVDLVLGRLVDRGKRALQIIQDDYVLEMR